MTETTQQTELRILKNFIDCMSLSCRSITANFVIVGDILLAGLGKYDIEKCIAKCRELGIDPYGYEI